jgi:hypothetical protein
MRSGYFIEKKKQKPQNSRLISKDKIKNKINFLKNILKKPKPTLNFKQDKILVIIFI